MKLWHVETGVCEKTFTKHTEVVTSCAWLPCGTKFVSGSTDKHIFLWTAEGSLLFKWSGVRIHDLAVTNDGKNLLAVTEKRIRMFSFEDKSEIW